MTRRTLLLGAFARPSSEENVVDTFVERFNEWAAIANWRLDHPNHPLNRFLEEKKAFQSANDAWKQVLKRAKRIYALEKGDCE